MKFLKKKQNEKNFIIEKINKEIQVKFMKEVKRRWSIQEHKLFIKACLAFGPHWKKVTIFFIKIHDRVATRSLAQIRSHAHKYTINLCKKYNIEMKSKWKDSFITHYLNFPLLEKIKKKFILLKK
jgi:hypothetical protein